MYHNMTSSNTWNQQFAEQDIRFAEFIDWLNKQEQKFQDVVTIAMQLHIAYNAKFSPLEKSPCDNMVLDKVEQAQNRLGVNFLYEP